MLSDLNKRLIEAYRAIKEEPEGVLCILGRWPYARGTFYRIRQMIFDDKHSRAAQFIYLNRTCWNGLYRVNRKGQFNVPFGRFLNPTVSNRNVLVAASKALQRARLRVADFEDATQPVEKGDFVYLDPPYSVAHEHNGFLRYNEHLFSWQDQVRLAACARRLSRRGATVLVSNAFHPTLLKLYPDFHRLVLTRRSLLAADSGNRGIAREVLFSSVRLPFGLSHATRVKA